MDYVLLGLLSFLALSKLLPDKPKSVIGMRLTGKTRYFDD